MTRDAVNNSTKAISGYHFFVESSVVLVLSVFHDWESGNRTFDGVTGSMNVWHTTLEKVEVFTDDLDGFSRNWYMTVFRVAMSADQAMFTMSPRDT